MAKRFDFQIKTCKLNTFQTNKHFLKIIYYEQLWIWNWIRLK
jgi:hypothetical protein